jgi:hypothetical protein
MITQNNNLINLSVVFVGILFMLSAFPAFSETCYHLERYCVEYLNDGKCKRWDYREVEYPCIEPEMCFEVRETCLNPECSERKYEEYETPCIYNLPNYQFEQDVRNARASQPERCDLPPRFVPLTMLVCSGFV